MERHTMDMTRYKNLDFNHKMTKEFDWNLGVYLRNRCRYLRQSEEIIQPEQGSIVTDVSEYW